MDHPQSMVDIKERGSCVLPPPITFATQSLPAVRTSGKSHFDQSALNRQMRLMEDQSNLAQFACSSKEYEQARGSQFGQPLDIAQVADIVQEPPPVLLPDSACKYNSPLDLAQGQPSSQPVTLYHVFESNCNVSLGLAPPPGISQGSDLAQGPSCAPLSQSSRKYNVNLALAQGQPSSQNPVGLQMPESAQGPQLTLPTAPGSCPVSNLAQGLPFAQLPDYSRESNLPLDPAYSQQVIQVSRTLQESGSAQGPPLLQPLRTSQVLNPATGPSQGLTSVKHFNTLVNILIHCSKCVSDSTFWYFSNV